MTQYANDKLLIGSEEWCAFPSLGIPAIKARVDSGAKTSCVHAVNIQTFKRNGANWVSFEVHPVQDNRRVVARCEAPVVDRRTVRSSSHGCGAWAVRSPRVVPWNASTFTFVWCGFASYSFVANGNGHPTLLQRLGRHLSICGHATLDYWLITRWR